MTYTGKVERWGVFELAASGKKSGNPFTDYTIKAQFTGENECVSVNGFYDGNGIYKVCFMPRFEGEYSFSVSGTFSDETLTGKFTAVSPQGNNHGYVEVSDKFHFSYADGTPYFCIGTTCYVWHLQTDKLIEQTLETLKNSPFNKIRFCIFPKHYDYNLGEPRCYPYEGTPMDSTVLTRENFFQYSGDNPDNHWDFTRFNPEYFSHIERCIAKLMDMGIEADLILMHPYDRWGFSGLNREQNRHYLQYVTARFSAYRNVWWSLANEYDIMSHKTVDDWEFYARVIMDNDPYGHLRSIHNCGEFYDHTKPWITHCSIQRQDLYKSSELVNEWRERFQKPVVLDEIAYEGDIPHGWGNITAQEMTRRFWEAVCRGGYPGHGETYLCDENILWWSHGGILRGESAEKIAFLCKVTEDIPEMRLKPYNAAWDEVCGVPENGQGGYYLFYYSFMRPSSRDYYFDDDTYYTVEVIDTWNMTVESAGCFKGKFTVKLPARQYIAVKITAIPYDL